MNFQFQKCFQPWIAHFVWDYLCHLLEHTFLGISNKKRSTTLNNSYSRETILTLHFCFFCYHIDISIKMISCSRLLPLWSSFGWASSELGTTISTGLGIYGLWIINSDFIGSWGINLYPPTSSSYSNLSIIWWALCEEDVISKVVSLRNAPILKVLKKEENLED